VSLKGEGNRAASVRGKEKGEGGKKKEGVPARKKRVVCRGYTGESGWSIRKKKPPGFREEKHGGGGGKKRGG